MKVTVKEAAAMAKTSPTTLYTRIAKGELARDERGLVELSDVMRLEFIFPLSFRRALGEATRRGCARRKAEKAA